MHHGEIMVVLIVLIIAVSRVMRDRGAPGIGRRLPDGDGYKRFARHMRAVRGEGEDGEAERLRGEGIVTDGDRNRSIALEEEIEGLRDRAAARRSREMEG